LGVDKPLPHRALFDTTVIINALGDRPDDPTAPTCKSLFEAMMNDRRQILIAAPTIAELLRSDSGAMAPRSPSIEIVAFDDIAAYHLGTKFPERLLIAKANALKLPRAYMKYDAMIVACATRHRAEVLVTLDKAQAELAKEVGLRAVRPEEFEEQLDLPGT